MPLPTWYPSHLRCITSTFEAIHSSGQPSWTVVTSLRQATPEWKDQNTRHCIPCCVQNNQHVWLFQTIQTKDSFVKTAVFGRFNSKSLCPYAVGICGCEKSELWTPNRSWKVEGLKDSHVLTSSVSCMTWGSLRDSSDIMTSQRMSWSCLDKRQTPNTNACKQSGFCSWIYSHFLFWWKVEHTQSAKEKTSNMLVSEFMTPAMDVRFLHIPRNLPSQQIVFFFDICWESFLGANVTIKVSYNDMDPQNKTKS